MGTLAQELRTLRVEAKLSLGGLALQAGVHKATLSRWESGLQQPRIPELKAVLTTLRVSHERRQVFFALLEAVRGVIAHRASLDSLLPSAPVGGDLLQAMRLRLGRSLEEVACALGLPKSTILRWERSETWPEVSQLHSLCCLLDAHPQEAIALTRGRFALPLPEAQDENDPDLLERLHRELFELVYRRYGPEDEALEDLRFLSLEGRIWKFAAHCPPGRLLLAHIYYRRSEFLNYRMRYRESQKYAERALAVSQTLPLSTRRRFTWGQLWYRSPEVLVHLIKASLLARRGGEIARAEAADHLLREAVDAPNPEMRAALLSHAARHMSGCAGRTEESIQLAQTACTIAADCHPGTVHRFRQRDLIRIHLKTGRPRPIVELVESLVAVSLASDGAAQRMDDRLLLAETYLLLEDRPRTQVILEETRTFARVNHITFHQRRLSGLTLQAT